MDKKVRKEIIDWVQTLSIALIIAFLIRNYVFQPYRVQMGSMMPTLQENNLIIVNKLIYRFNSPKRGDIVVFHPPNNPSVFYIKRVIALPGDTIEINNGEVMINGVTLKESYLSIVTPGIYGPKTIIKDEYFLMGDHRNNSLDSREFGPIKIKSIIGRATLVLWPPKAFTILHDAVYQ
jgi:signal peptidase I